MPLYIAELWGVLEGIRLVRKRGLNAVELEVDSLAVVRAFIQGEEEGSVQGWCLYWRRSGLIASSTSTKKQTQLQMVWPTWGVTSRVSVYLMPPSSDQAVSSC